MKIALRFLLAMLTFIGMAFSFIVPVSAAKYCPSQFNARLRSIREDYLPMAWKAMMNLADSHDTNRLRFMLKKTNNDND